jgi:hypothetical protein
LLIAHHFPATRAPSELPRMLADVRSLTIALSLVLYGGCACRDCCPAVGAPSPLPALDCRPVDRQPLRPDVSALPPQGEVLRAGGEQKLCALTEQTTQCLAATNATIANLLVQEAEAASAQRKPLHPHSRESALTSELLRLDATRKRNAAAAAALEAFLRLAEAEAGADGLERRGHELDLMLADISHLQERGLLSVVSKGEIEGQRLELWHRQSELRASILKLNYQLQDLLGVEIVPDARFWPEASLVVTNLAPDRNEAVNLALANRADLAELRLAAGADARDSVAAARTVLQLSGGGLGTAPQTPSCLGLLQRARSTDCEGSARSQQMADLLADRTRAARHETLSAVVVLEAGLEQIGMTQARLHVAKEHLKSAEQQQQVTAGAPLNVRKARLDVIGVEQDLLHDVIEWKLALVKLKEAQGLLAVECGYDAAAKTVGPWACGP